MHNSLKPIYTWMCITALCIALSFSYTIAHATTITRNDQISDPLVFIAERIKLFEGFRATRYRDSVCPHVWLQGYGRSIRGHTPAKISRATADGWLMYDLTKCRRHLDQYMPWWRSLSPIRQAVMLDLTYNLGIDKLRKFKKFLSCMQCGEYTSASACLVGTKHRRTSYARQVGVRSREISHAIMHNEWKHIKK